MSKTWVKTDYVPEESKELITEGKWYEVVKYDYRSGSILDEEQRYIFILFNGCAFLHNRSWTVHEGDTPPTEEIKKVEDMSKVNTIDWSKAPKDATHFSPDGRWCKWYKQVNGVWYYYGDLKWNLSSNIKAIQDRYIPRYTVQPQTEWKIRHIKSDDYKSGRDVAITVLYKELGDGYYEYKFAICSHKDMFSRKKGVEEALKKESDKLYDEGSAPFIGLVLMHMSISNKFSKGARSLILSKMAELV